MRPDTDPNTANVSGKPVMARPDVAFDISGFPRSLTFDDFYFSTDNGLAESGYVFLLGNELEQRFTKLPEHGHFTIVETGFGTGLNAMASWELFEQTAAPTARLIFVSIERYPMSKQEISRSLSAWPQLSERVATLTDRYPPRVPGFHLVELSDQVDLLLLFGDAKETLKELNARVDAWFLDGFSPGRNPEMWHPEIFQAMARLSHRATTVATFTSASEIRARLHGAGFSVNRKSGYGKKREMLQATYEGISGPPSPGLWPHNEWYWPSRRQAQAERSAIVVGAGLAGAYTASELARRGWQITVLEQADQVAAGASGNAQGALYARLSHHDTPVNRFYTQALHLAQTRLGNIPDDVPHQRCGLLQLNQGAKEARRFTHLQRNNPFGGEMADCVSRDEASQLAGTSLPAEALYFPDGGWIQPPSLIRHLLRHPNIRVLTGHRVTSLQPADDELWCVSADIPGEQQNRFSAAQVILCNAWQASALAQSQHLPLKPIGGQVTRIESTPALAKLRAVICSDRYLVPAYENAHSLGASFHLDQQEPFRRHQDDLDNLTNAHQRLPDLITGRETIVDARAGQRCASPDYFPQVGPLLDKRAFTRIYQHGLTRRLTNRLPAPPHYPGLWVNLAHGSKGLCSIPLASRVLAGWINGEPLALAQSVANHINPNRFVIRELVRGQK